MRQRGKPPELILWRLCGTSKTWSFGPQRRMKMFLPLAWCIDAHLVEERERACDEEVLSRGSHSEVYADAILSVCKLYAQSPLA